MLYCTVQDLIDRYGERELIELTDRDQVGVINLAVINKAITDASVMIEAKIPQLETMPPVLTHVACEITRFLLYDDSAPEIVILRYQDALKFLDSYKPRSGVVVKASAQVFDDKTLGKMP